MILTRR